MATSTRLPAFSTASTVCPGPDATSAPPRRRSRADGTARLIGLSTICLLAGTSLHFLNLI